MSLDSWPDVYQNHAENSINSKQTFKWILIFIHCIHTIFNRHVFIYTMRIYIYSEKRRTTTFLESVRVISKLSECPFAFQSVVYLRTKFKQYISDHLHCVSTPRKTLNSIKQRCSSAPWTFNDRSPMMMMSICLPFVSQIRATYTLCKIQIVFLEELFYF